MLSHFSLVRLFVTPRTVACQVPLSRGFSRQEYWSARPCPSLVKEKTATLLITKDIQGICAQPSQPEMWETLVRFLGWEDPLEKG